jgi:hypothetical protein
LLSSLNDLSLHDSAMIIPWPHAYSVEWYLDQVTIARVFNWDVHQRRSKQAIKETWSVISQGQPMWLGQIFFVRFATSGRWVHHSELFVVDGSFAV